MNLANGTEERRLVESYKFNGWELDINSRSLISPTGEQYKLPRSEFPCDVTFSAKTQEKSKLVQNY